MYTPRSLPIAEYQFKTLQEAASTAEAASLLFPRPETVLFGLHELMLNAVEHGNLGISYEEKGQLLAAGNWLEEVKRRLLLPEFAGKIARAMVYREASATVATIQDEGNGFNWRKYTNAENPDMLPNGRGILSAIHISFSRVEYNDVGNRVTAWVMD